MRPVSCGVIVTDGPSLLLGHATRSPRWDIPKGLAEPDETFAAAAVRELREETGLVAASGELTDLGVQAYMKDKDLALFAWIQAELPESSSLVCASTFTLAGSVLPEFDRFGIFSWDEALLKVGKNMARVLGAVRSRLDRAC